LDVHKKKTISVALVDAMAGQATFADLGVR